MKRWLNNNVNIFYHHFCKKIDPNDKRHGGDLVASVLKSHGVQHVFTLSGGHVAPVLTGAEKLGIKIIDTRHEVTTVFAADASARLSGVPGVAVVTAGPGVTNTVTAVKNAQMAESPIVLLGGAAAGILKGRGALQDIEQLSIFKTITKKQFIIEKVRDIVPMMKEAFQTAQSGTPGPVYVELPIDILYPYAIISKEFISSTGGKSLQGKLVDWYLNNYLQNLFAGAFDDEHPDLSPLPVDIPYPSEADIGKAIELLTQAKKPLVILGSQSVLPPVGANALRKAVEDLGIPVYLGGMSRGLLGRNSPINMRQARREALRDADLVILGGSVADFRLSYGRVFSKKSKIIAINRSREQLYKNAGVFWQPSVAVQGDPAKFFVEVANKLKGTFKVDADWVKTLRDRDTEKESKATQMANQPTDRHLNPLKVLQTLENTMDDNTILVADGGDFVGSAAYILRPRGPLSWLDPGAFGTLGVGAGFALGAKLCRPDADVIVVFGDGSLGYSLAEFDTMVRHKLPVMAVVGNDACWTQIAREQLPMLGSDVSCRLAFTNYDKAAEGLGAAGIKLTATENDTLKEKFEEAKSRVRGGQPVLINVLIGKSKFREGSISV
ncbi:PREDICTED: acetolactate synthase-like protein [Rhagoletis zephyria]|uniref:acetolactate synthase-like protein n=1 Tax=Rhagoletis zephyria TaxID=28612 RepID=UPI0008119ACE|nr:PREDICTED: acetolactate synthase-like protein [Rhagoletis zephyria]